MFHSLPAQTVFEAQARNRRDTLILFTVLVVLYVVFFNLIAFALFGDVGRAIFSLTGQGASLGDLARVVTVVALVVALGHFLVARSKTLDDVLAALRAGPADRTDRYHQVFLNLVEEASAATGIRPLRAVLIPSPGCNAFAVADGRGNAAIGVTEGLLTRLERNELAAVVAHEASHLVNGDSRLMTTACSLFGILGSIRSGLGGGPVETRHGRFRSRQGGGGRLVLAWGVATVGYLLTKMACMALSRTRETLADDHAVQITKDPLSLAQALAKIAGKYRGGGGDVNEGYAPLFILNPSESRLDEGTSLFSDLFSTHPPLAERLENLLGYARADMATLQKNLDRSAASKTAAPAPASAPEPRFFANKDGEWFGPSTPQQLLAAGLLGPQSWVCPEGGTEVLRAGDTPALLPLLQGLGPKVDSAHACPRCHVPMVAKNYEGLDVLQCAFCKGYLLKAGYVERVIARREERFAEEDISKARAWRDRQRGTLRENCAFPAIRCPSCGQPMSKMFHSLVTRVVLDRCTGDRCRAVWCDGGELETLQMLVESDARAAGF